MRHPTLNILSTLILGVILSVLSASAQSAEDSTRPKRMYVNVTESEKLTFAEPIDTTSVSITKVVKLQQPNDTTLLVEALEVGRTTVTVILRSGAIERYFVSTFENRGADILSIQNLFTDKGYKLLKVEISRDQVTLTGTVTTQEELDDAVKIVKRFSPYVNVKATVGQVQDTSEINENEAVIINNIQRIAQVPGLIVKVKFPQPTETISSTTQRFSGDRFQNITTSRSDSAGRVTDSRVEFPGQTSGGGGAAGAANAASATEKKPLENVQETVSRSENNSIPEKIFLSGTVEDDLQKARAIRVARTFCSLIVSFIVVKDPIQVRIDLSIVEINLTKARNVGLRWTDNSGAGSPSIGSAVGYSGVGSTSSVFDNILDKLTYGLQIDARATLNLLENEGIGRRLQEPSIFLSNGQPGSFFVGETIPYVRGFSRIDGDLIPQVESLPVGVGVYILPVNFEVASQNVNEKLSVVNSDGTPRIPSLAEIKRLENPVQLSAAGGSAIKVSEVDDNIKYVDENGLVGMNIISSISTFTRFEQITDQIQVPRTSNRSLSTRVFLKDGQSCVVSGLFDDNLVRDMRKLPILSDIPLFGWLFKNPSTDKSKSEILFVYTPSVIRTATDAQSKLIRRPKTPEMETFIKQLGFNKRTGGNKPLDDGILDNSGVSPESTEVRKAEPLLEPSSATSSLPVTTQEESLPKAPQPVLPEIPLSTGTGESFYPPLLNTIEPAPAPSPTTPSPAPLKFTAPASTKPGVSSDLRLRREEDESSSSVNPNVPVQPAIDTTALRQILHRHPLPGLRREP